MKTQDTSQPVAERENELKTVHTGTNYGISPDHFEKVIEDLPEEQAEILRWWYCHGKETGLSLSKLAQRAGISSATFSLVFRGKYAAELGSLCARLIQARLSYAHSVENPDFIMTSLARRLYAIFQSARDLACVYILWGKMGTGKTVAAKNYKREHNHGRTIYYRCGAAVSFGVFLGQLAATMGITVKNRGHQEVRIKILNLMRAGQRLLIVDELHELFETCTAATAIKICEFFREIHDEAECGLVLIGTPVLRKHLIDGVHKEALAQLVNRSPDGPITLPAKHTKQDVIAIHKHYGLAAPTDPDACRILGDLIKTNSLRKLVLALRSGARFAQIKGEKLTWSHFVQAHDERASLICLADEDDTTTKAA